MKKITKRLCPPQYCMQRSLSQGAEALVLAALMAGPCSSPQPFSTRFFSSILGSRWVLIFMCFQFFQSQKNNLCLFYFFLVLKQKRWDLGWAAYQAALCWLMHWSLSILVAPRSGLLIKSPRTPPATTTKKNQNKKISKKRSPPLPQGL